MGRKQTTGDVLNARAKTNGYKRGAHREEDSRRDYSKHKDDTIKDQDNACMRCTPIPSPAALCSLVAFSSSLENDTKSMRRNEDAKLHRPPADEGIQGT